jgi:phosphoribosyl 1,2-cyclic phosphodiesterase
MEIRFWGVRGSVATSGAEMARIGGNTSCVELTSQGHRVILDAGTGIRGLGEAMLREDGAPNALMLWSHLHWDHVQGFPFFAPAWHPAARLELRGPGPEGGRALREVLAAQMQPPTFPVPLAAMRGGLTFGDVLPGAAFEHGPFRITPFALPHPQGCLGYRLDADGRSFVYATDVELSLQTLSADVARHLEGVDAMALDAQYTEDEYAGRQGAPRRGWGHSTNVDAARVAAACSVRRLLLFHHDPAHNDELVEAMAEEARNHFEASEPAREGKRLWLDEALASG